MGLLDRAKRVLGGGPPAGPVRSQAYRVACPEGHVLHGHRTEGYQALRCPECNEGVFILPRSPLPEPVAPKSSSAAARRREPAAPEDELVLGEPPSPAESARARAEHAATRRQPAQATPDEEAEAEIEWIDAEEEAGAAQAPAIDEPRRPAARPQHGTKKKKAQAREAAAAREPEPVPPGMIAIEEPAGFGEWARRNRNPLIFVAVAVLVVATVAFRLRQRRIEDLPRLAEIGRTKGLDALDAGDFATAKQVLAEAARAVEGLGGEVEGAEEILQGAREAALLADFRGGSLRELVEEAAKSNPPDTWTARFDSVYKGRSDVFMAQVMETPDPSRPGSGYVLDLPIFYGPGPTPEGRGRLDLAGFRLLELARPRVGDVVTFGARIASVRFDAEKGEWVVALEPDSGAFITHNKALSRLPGWAEDAQAAELTEAPK